MNTPLRYRSQVNLEGFGPDGQEKLAGARVLVIGAGGLGCPVLTILAGAGIGTIGIIDNDVVEEKNLPRQNLYTPEDIGQLKVTVAGRRLKELNPETELIPIQERFDTSNALRMIEDYDVVVDCTDNFASRYLINDACVIRNKPWVSGAIDSWSGQVSFFNVNGGPTYRCLFPESENNNVLNCEETGVLPTLCWLTGSIMANEIIKFFSGTGELLSGKMLVINSLLNSFNTISFSRDIDAVTAITALQNDYSVPCTAIEILPSAYLQNRNIYDLVDIREPQDFEAENAGGINRPYYELIENGIISTGDRRILLVCDTGKKSRVLAEKLSGDHENIFSMKGGYSALKEAINSLR